MGFAKYQEDILSRYVHDDHLKGNRTVQQRGHGTKPRRPPTTKEAVAMSPLKEFTVQSARPLPVLILADVSGSMNTDGKIQALNLAVREMVEAFKDEADLLAEIHLGVITFGGQAKVHQPLVATQNVTWSDLAANGATPMGKAFDIARELAPLAKALMRERTRPARLRSEAGKLLAALGKAALSTPSLIGQIEKVARTGLITVSIAPKDLKRLRGDTRGSRANPQLYPAALAICAAVVFSSEPLLAALLALLSVVLAIADWLRQR